MKDQILIPPEIFHWIEINQGLSVNMRLLFEIIPNIDQNLKWNSNKVFTYASDKYTSYVLFML